MHKKTNIFLRFIYYVFGYCHMHGWFMYPKRFRQNTAYLIDEANYSFGCKYCQEESHAYWEERWKDYYSGIL
jgi:hypothetical protein